jgi:hypothetical protein
MILRQTYLLVILVERSEKSFVNVNKSENNFSLKCVVFVGKRYKINFDLAEAVSGLSIFVRCRFSFASFWLATLPSFIQSSAITTNQMRGKKVDSNKTRDLSDADVNKTRGKKIPISKSENNFVDEIMA